MYERSLYFLLPFLFRVLICGRRAGQPQWDIEPKATRLGYRNSDRETAVIDSRSQATQ